MLSTRSRITPSGSRAVEEREPATDVALRPRHLDVVGDEPVAAVADLDAYAGIADLDDERTREPHAARRT